MGSHGLVMGIFSHGSVLLSRGWLITVEAPTVHTVDAVVVVA